MKFGFLRGNAEIGRAKDARAVEAASAMNRRRLVFMRKSPEKMLHGHQGHAGIELCRFLAER
ncbi:hypothetical protein [Sphingomonas sp. LH128]|jgi:hypothetical protein|uniref:hypothetical protein n=1 Tax=Sphingomonas sp. LH128 TaxID=473781 RepID=UPI001930CBF1|nr:hypothetical protein [Sphingomonas sp. LH128]